MEPTSKNILRIFSFTRYRKMSALKLVASIILAIVSIILAIIGLLAYALISADAGKVSSSDRYKLYMYFLLGPGLLMASSIYLRYSNESEEPTDK